MCCYMREKCHIGINLSGENSQAGILGVCNNNNNNNNILGKVEQK